MKSIVLFAAVLRIILITAIISFTIIANAQSVAVNTTGNSADASAMLDISSTSKGFLPPRMTTAQRTGIPSPANGLMVYDTDTKTYWYFSDAWKEITNAGGGGFNLPYSGSYADPNKVFSIINTSASSSRVAIYGKGSNVFTGLIPSDPTGVWGEEDQGIGVTGTSNGKYGIYGRSLQSHGVYGFSLGTSAAVYGSSNNSQGLGVMGYMPNGGIAVIGENSGSQGNAGKFFISNANNNGNTADIYTYGSGRALMAQVLNTNSGAEAATINTNGLGSALGAYILNSASNSNATNIMTNGLGSALYAKISNANSNSSVIYGLHNGSGNVIYAESTGGGTAIYGKTNKPFGEAIYAENTSSGQGQAITAKSTGTNASAIIGYGKGTGTSDGAIKGINEGGGPGVLGSSFNPSWGIGVMGTADVGIAGYFLKGGNSNVGVGLQVANQSLSKGATINMTNMTNTSVALEIQHQGTGKIASFNNSSGEVGSIGNNGNIQTDGTVTVKSNKGIVRSSTSVQMRYEAIPAVVEALGGNLLVLCGNCTMYRTINFPTAFSTPPAVSFGNLVSGSGGVELLDITITSVTTTGCTLRIENNIGTSLSFKGTWNLLAIGPE